MFINVIDNAIKYSNPGSTITVSAEEVGNMIQVTITDNGVGISAADLPRVKTKFSRRTIPGVDRASGLLWQMRSSPCTAADWISPAN